MAIIIGENSWETIAEADAYLTNKLGSQPWFLLPDTAGAGVESKELFLIMAFNTLVSAPSYCLTPDLTDDNVKKSQSELAFNFVSSYDSFIAQSDVMTRGVKSFDLSKWSEEYFESWKGDFPLPACVSMFISAYRADNIIVDLEVE